MKPEDAKATSAQAGPSGAASQGPQPSLAGTWLRMIARAVGGALLLVLVAAGTMVAAIVGIVLSAALAVLLGPLLMVFYAITAPLGGVYRHVLTQRYLRRQLAPLFAMAAVALSVAMVIIVISVMGGFLSLMRNATRTLEGDVILDADVMGIPHYETLLTNLEALPQVKAAAPIIQGYGLVNLGGHVHTVQVMGVDPQRLDRVVKYGDALYWKTDDLVGKLLEVTGPLDSLTPSQRRELESLQERYRSLDLRQLGMTLKAPEVWARNATKGQSSDVPGAVLGIEVSPYNLRDEQGRYSLDFNRSLGAPVTLTVLPLTAKGGILEPQARRLVVVNEFKSGLYEIDANRVYVPFAMLQQMLKMDPYEAVNEAGEPTGQMVPGKASMVVVRAKADVPLAQLKAAVEGLRDRFLQEHRDVPALRVRTWEQLHSTFLGAVQMEKRLLGFLFVIISMVTLFMILVILSNIVTSKTRDIGVIRALGASRSGVATVFLGYGLAIGLVGAALGCLIGVAFVWNINEIQDLLGLVLGFKIWTPEVYYFDRIPSQVNWEEVAFIVAGAILCSVVGSVWPAIRAGTLNPVDALRYE